MKKQILLLIAMVTCLCTFAQIPTSGLVAYYPMGIPYSTVSPLSAHADASGNNYNLTVTSGFGHGAGRNSIVGEAAEYNGGFNDKRLYNYTANQTAFQPADFTVSAWVRLGSPYTNGNQTVIQVGENDIYLRFINNGSNYFLVGGYRTGASSFKEVFKLITLSDYTNTWRLVTIRKSGNFLQLFQGTALLINDNTATSAVAYSASNKEFKVGCSGVASEAFNGRIQDVFYYNIAVNPASLICIIQPPTIITPAANYQNICPGTSVTLQVSSPELVNWYTTPVGGTAIANAYINTFGPINSSITYYLDATNGCASFARVPIKVTVATAAAPTNTTPAGNLTVCSGNTTVLSATGASLTWYAGSSGGSSLGSGNSFTTPAITGNVTYYVQDGVGSCASARTPIAVTLASGSAPATPVNTSVSFNQTRCGNSTSTLSVSGTGTINWYNTPAGGTSLGTGSSYTTPALANPPSPAATSTVTYYAQASSGCASSARLAIPITVKYQYSFTNTTPVANLTVCAGSTTTLSITTNAPTIEWAESAGGISGPVLGTAATFITPSISSATTFLAFASGNSTLTCNAGEFITVNVTSPPAAPTNTTPAADQITCAGLSAPLSASGSGTLRWYNVVSGGSILGTGTTFNTPSITVSPTTYYVENFQGSCASSRTAIAVTLYAVPAMPVSNTPAANLTVCSGSGTILSVVPAATGFYTSWWTTPTGTGSTYIQMGSSLTVGASSIPTNTSFWVETQNSTTGCRSTRLEIPVVVNTTPATPINTTVNQTACLGSPVTLSATGTGTLEWFNVPSAGTVLTTGGSYLTGNLTAPVTLYVSAKSGTCISPRFSMTVNVAPIPNNPVVTGSGNVICTGQRLFITNVTLNQANHSVKWYAASSGGTALSTDTFRTPVLNISTTYYASSSSNTTGCESSRVPVTVTVLSPAITSITATLDTSNCAGQATTLTANATGGTLTYSWSTGAFGATTSVSPSSTTTYTVTVTTTPANCTASATKTIVVNPTISASIAGPDSICPGATASLTASGGGTYAWSNNLGSGAVKSVTPTANTTYTVTVTSGTCQAIATKTISLKQAPLAGFGQSAFDVCNGGSVTLTGTGNPLGSTYAWSTGQTGNPITTIPTTTPTTTYTLTVTLPNGCSTSDSRTVNVYNVVASISGPSIVCTGASATLTASGGTTFAWSNNLGSGPSKTVTPSVTTTYTVTVTGAGNCTATASQTVSLQSAPTASISGASSVCSGSSVTLTATGGNTYAWANNLGTNAAITVTPTTATTYTVTVSIGANCTASATKTVSIKQATSSTQNQTICQGKTVSFNGQQLAQSGTYRDTLINAAGCDSILTLNLTVSPALQGSFAQTICKGKTFSFNGQTLAQSGAYRDTLQTTGGCDSIVTLNLTVTPALQGSFAQTICAGKTFSFNGQTLAQSGTFKDTLQTSGGCDSIVTLNLTVTPALQGSFSQTICFGDSYKFNGQTLAQSGAYRDTLQTTGGCDSIITLNLTALNKIENVINASICTGQSYSFKGQSLTQTGQYFDTLQTTLGCDSFVTLNLSVNSFVTGSFNKAICQGESFTFNGQALTQNGQFLDTLISSGGCDSIVTLTLSVNALPQPTITQSGFDLSTQSFATYQWQLSNSDINGAQAQNYTATQNGNYTVIVTDANGCSNTSGLVNVTGVGIEDVSNQINFTLYPNPTNSIIHLVTDATIETITVYNLQGQNVLEAKLNITQLDFSNLAEGTYILQIITANGIARRTVIKQ